MATPPQILDVKPQMSLVIQEIKLSYCAHATLKTHCCVLIIFQDAGIMCQRSAVNRHMIRSYQVKMWWPVFLFSNEMNPLRSSYFELRVVEANDAFENANWKFAVCLSLSEENSSCFDLNWQLKAGRPPFRALTVKCDCLANRLLSLLPILTKVWKTPKCVNSLQREKCRQEKKAAWTLCQSKKSNGHSVSGELQSCTHTHVTHTRRQMLKFSKSYRLYKLNIKWVHSQRGVNPPHPTRKGLRKSTSTPCHCVIH